MSYRTISRVVLDRAVELQGHRCGYCLLPFGTLVYTKHGSRILTPQADHLVPYSFGGASSAKNCVAACQLCNLIKGALVFDDILDVQRYILHKQKQSVEFIPDTPSTLDATAWSREYAAYLAE